MSAKLIGILAVGVGLATLMLTALRAVLIDLRREIAREPGTLRDDLRGDMQTLRDELRGDAQTARDALRADIRGIEERMRTQERGMVRLEGLLEGLREAVVIPSGRCRAGAPPRSPGLRARGSRSKFHYCATNDDTGCQMRTWSLSATSTVTWSPTRRQWSSSTRAAAARSSTCSRCVTAKARRCRRNVCSWVIGYACRASPSGTVTSS